MGQFLEGFYIEAPSSDYMGCCLFIVCSFNVAPIIFPFCGNLEACEIASTLILGDFAVVDDSLGYMTRESDAE